MEPAAPRMITAAYVGHALFFITTHELQSLTFLVFGVGRTFLSYSMVSVFSFLLDLSLHTLSLLSAAVSLYTYSLVLFWMLTTTQNKTARLQHTTYLLWVPIQRVCNL